MGDSLANSIKVPLVKNSNTFQRNLFPNVKVDLAQNRKGASDMIIS